MCAYHRERSRPKRLLNQKTSGVHAAQTHASMKMSATGPAGDITRNPKARGSRSRLTAVTVASEVQKMKMRTSSRELRRQRLMISGRCK